MYEIRCLTQINATEVAQRSGLSKLISNFVAAKYRKLLDEDLGRVKPRDSDIGRAAAQHGNELLRKEFTVDQVVHD